jgi:prepilin-type N-terminal cleavage/methylation domain-containing protein
MKKTAFSLIELAIVLIIIGLLTAGVTAASKLIEQSEINKVAAELSNHKTSYMTFFLTYKEYPGDMSRAIETFDLTVCGNPLHPPCRDRNGDGDGKVEVAANFANESKRAWEHLSYAKLLEHDMTYDNNPRHDNTATKAGSPPTSIENTCYAIAHISEYSSGFHADMAHTFMPDGILNSNGISMGENASVGCTSTHRVTQNRTDYYHPNGRDYHSIHASFAAKLDTKIDDSYGNSGNIIGRIHEACQIDGTYAVDSDRTQCSLFYSFNDS